MSAQPATPPRCQCPRNGEGMVSWLLVPGLSRARPGLLFQSIPRRPLEIAFPRRSEPDLWIIPRKINIEEQPIVSGFTQMKLHLGFALPLP